jgi:outer membrane immunogenic protein
MRKLLMASMALVGLAAISPASAADMALKAPPPPPWYDWSGFYIGANGGYSWGHSSTSFTGTTGLGGAITPFTTTQDLNGGLGGGQIGYNWQFNKNWVWGLEADFQGTGQDGSAAAPPLPIVVTIPGVAVTVVTTSGTFAQKLPWFGTVRGRLGFEPADRWLLYVTGGLAYGQVDSTANVTVTTATPGGTATASVSSSNNSTRAGWTIGGGSEWAFWDRWSAKLEYLYIDLGTFSSTFAFAGLPGASLASLTTSSHVTDNIFRAGINYHFGAPWTPPH